MEALISSRESFFREDGFDNFNLLTSTGKSRLERHFICHVYTDVTFDIWSESDPGQN